MLRGPQGTLWGRNATGGVISWITRRPTSDFEGRLTASYGTWDDVKVQDILSGPLTKGLRARVAASFNRRGGTTDNLFAAGRDEYGDIQENTVLRATVEADVSPSFLVTANVHYGRYLAQSPPRGFFGALDATGARCPVDRIFAGECQGGPGAGNFRNPDPNPHEAYSELGSAEIDNKNWGGWLRGEWDMGDGWSLLSLTSHDEVRRIQNIDVDGSGTPGQHVQFFIEHKQTTQELRAAYSSDKFDGTIGAYYYKDDRIFTVTIPTLRIGSYAERDGESYAVFGQGTYAITPAINLTAGLRYTKDDIQYPNIAFGQNGRPREDFATPVFRTSRSTRGSKLTWRAAADWHFDPDHMVFGSISTGYKSAAVNSALPTSNAAVTTTEPENLTAYELGLKGSFGAPSGLRYSITAFHNDYKNIQVGATSSSATVIVTQLLNIDSAKISGFEAELSATPIRGLSLDLGLGYLDGEYSAPATLRIGNVPLDGKRPVLMPQFTISGAVRYEHDLGGSAIYVGADGRWQDQVFFGPDNLPTESQDAYALFNARIGWKLADDSLSVEAYVKNLTDKEYFAHIVDNGALGTVNVTWGQPRTFGVQLTKRF
ncbi:TonB-dependent receptor [Sphingomonas sp. AX6]|uniref:TonB-dependent receptor n=1 Tax=Sphingomonas sp. AX6 TaxID=2653171 RepID=UPI0012F3CF1B|nr:TonB-dependent receptor [Sphingomonas sp. AX6]VXC85011.1 putative Iron complex outermembrane recepter protein [Sphingomonas sp. AX6]